MPTEPLKVLLIEDDEDDYVLARDLLYEMDHREVQIRWETTYEGGRHALELGEHDVCLMDFALGARDGMALLREVEPETLRTPIIFLTGQTARDLDMKAIQAGASDYLVKGGLTASLLERTIRYAMQRQALVNEIHRRSLTDDLTGLLNRRGFEEQVTRELRLAVRRGKGVALMFLDIDRFKQINDRWGHVEGDRALREIAAIMEGTFRESDILARLGGDEFAIVPVDALPPNLEVPARRLREHLERRNQDTDRPYALSVSIGTALFDPADPRELDELLEAADREMYRSKPEHDPRPDRPAASDHPESSGNHQLPGPKPS